MSKQAIREWLDAVRGDWSRDARRDLKVACILDTFSASAFAPECDLLELSVGDWKAELDAFCPELILIESAWLGKNEEWRGAVGHFTSDVRGVLEWADRNDVPKAFWNKEDPVKFDAFLKVARHFDAVFTTDLDCVPRYKEKLGHDRCYFLPFAAQLEAHNPIETYERIDAFCFAGAYYANYPERTATLDAFVQTMPKYRPIEIYDRNFDNDIEQFQFPQSYERFIKGKLEFSEIDKAYKGYNYAININTVQQSQSMFARRIYELAACNTLTISNFSRGLRVLFGDYVVNSDKPDQILERLDNVFSRPLDDERVALGAMRTVVREHTYQDRLAYVCAKVIGQVAVDLQPTVAVIGRVSNSADAARIIASYSAQQFAKKQLIIVYDKHMTPDMPTGAPEDIRLVSSSEAMAIPISELSQDAGYIAFFHQDDGYGANYLEDLASATRYSDAHAVTRENYVRCTDSDAWQNIENGVSYGPVAEAPFRSSIFRVSALGQTPTSEILDAMDEGVWEGNTFAVGRFDYCQDQRSYNPSDSSDLPELATSTLPLRQGIPLEDLHRFADALPKPNIDEAVDEPSQLFHEFSNAIVACEVANPAVVRKFVNGKLELDADLPDDEFVYISSDLEIPISQVALDGYFALDFDCRPSDQNVQLAAIFLSDENERVGSAMARVSRTLRADYPDGTSKVQLQLRLAGRVSLTAHDLTCSARPNMIAGVQLANEIGASASGNVDAILGDEGLVIQSRLGDKNHEYLNFQRWRSVESLQVSETGKTLMHLETGIGLNVYLTVFFRDSAGERLGHAMVPPNQNFLLDVPDGAADYRIALRIGAGGRTVIRSLRFTPKPPPHTHLIAQSDVLVLTNVYPSYDNLYRNGFVHSRVRAYRENDLSCDVFVLGKSPSHRFREFQNVNVTTGPAQLLRDALASGQYRKVLVHFLDEPMWDVLKEFVDEIPVIAWVHGSEVQPWWRRTFNYKNDTELAIAKSRSDQRMRFWRSLISDLHPNLRFVFVSQYFADEVAEDVGLEIPRNQLEIIHNPIDTEIFDYVPKADDQRLKLLSIRPYASAKYANDLSVKAILELSKKDYFDELEILMVGDGELFDEILSPLEQFANVTLQRGFLSQSEIAALHKDYGIFLTPTRMDAQGVSRDEAMASGLIPVTNAVTAIPEFVDDQCGILAVDEDQHGMANGIDRVVSDPALFQRLSRAAAQRVRHQSAKGIIIAAELKLVND